MKYLIMECHKAYAIVMDEKGRFLKAANLNYEVGQKVTSIVEMKLPENTSEKSSFRFFSSRSLAGLSSLAACLCLVFFCFWQCFFTSFGMVKMQINPSVLISTNRIGYVTQLKGENEDGKLLVDSYRFHWKKLDTVVNELADEAVVLGYLKDGGEIHLTLFSKNQTWAENTEKRLISNLEEQFENTISITTEISGETTPAGKNPAASPAATPAPLETPSVSPAPAPLYPEDDDEKEDTDEDTKEDEQKPSPSEETDSPDEDDDEDSPDSEDSEESEEPEEPEKPEESEKAEENSDNEEDLSKEDSRDEDSSEED